jgi:hypothetical protein
MPLLWKKRPRSTRLYPPGVKKTNMGTLKDSSKAQNRRANYITHWVVPLVFRSRRPENKKLNTKSSSVAELVGVDDATTLILWTKPFLEAQGYRTARNVIHQDNKNAIRLESNGKMSSSKRTRAINILLRTKSSMVTSK